MPKKKKKQADVSRNLDTSRRAKRCAESRRDPSSDGQQEAVGPRYVELIRVSGQAQVKAETPESQRRALDQLALSRPGIRIARLEALAVSGAIPLHETEQGQELLTLAAEGFDELRLWDIDRGLGARADDPRDRLAIFSTAREANAVLIDCGGRVIDPKLEVGELDYYLRTFFAAQERRKIVQRTRAGRQRIAADGGYTGAGLLPYGLEWDRNAKCWSINEEHAAIIREIYQRCLDGASFAAIADQLNASGKPAPIASRWHPSSIGRFLRRPAYRGEHKQEGISVQVPAIIDEATWHKVQRVLAGRARRKPSQISRSMCMSRIWCPCGQRMYVRVGKKNREYFYCRTRHDQWVHTYQRPRCEHYATTHRAVDIDPLVWEAVKNAITQREILQSATQGDEDSARKHCEELTRCETLLKRLTNSENEITRAFRNGELSTNAWRAQLKELATDRHTLERNRDLARAQIAAADSTTSSLAAAETQIDALAHRIRNATPEDRKTIIRSVIPGEKPFGITLWPDGKIEIKGVVAITPPSDPSAPSGPKGPPVVNTTQLPAILVGKTTRRTWERLHQAGRSGDRWNGTSHRRTTHRGGTREFHDPRAHLVQLRGA